MASETKSAKSTKTGIMAGTLRGFKPRYVVSRFVIAVLAFFLAFSSTMALAADIILRPTNERKPGKGSLSIYISGPIEAGDADRLAELARQAGATGRPLLGVILNSPGGNLQEAVRISEIIRAMDMAAIMKSDTQCASACVLLFAAGVVRIVHRGARIGVHSASVDGQETADATLGTIVMARQASRLGIPDQIIGRMITAGPAGISWLTRDEVVALAGPYGVAVDY